MSFFYTALPANVPSIKFLIGFKTEFNRIDLIAAWKSLFMMILNVSRRTVILIAYWIPLLWVDILNNRTLDYYSNALPVIIANGGRLQWLLLKVSVFHLYHPWEEKKSLQLICFFSYLSVSSLCHVFEQIVSCFII